MSDRSRERALLRAVFAERSDKALRSAPPFARVWSAAARSSTSRTRPSTKLLRAAAVAGVLAVGAMVLGIVDLGTDPSDSSGDPWLQAESSAAAIAEWRAPLDFLLTTPGSNWLTSTPALPSISRPKEALP